MAAPTFFGVATNPADNGSLAEPQTAVVITPPASMQTGDLCIAIAYMMAGSAYPGLNATGGQTWNTDTTNFQYQGPSAYHKIWWARFNGTWSTNPSWSFASQAGTQAVGVQMLVFRPDSTSKLWYVANEPAWDSFAAPSTPFTITIPGTDLIKTDAVTLARWYSDDDNTYGSLSGANWSKTGLAAQYRNLAGSDNSVSFAYQLNGSPVSTGSVSQNQATLGGDAGAIMSVSFYATAGAPQSVTQDAQLQDADTFYALEKTNFRLNQSNYFVDDDTFFTAIVALAVFNTVLEQGAQFQDPDTFFQTIKTNFTLKQAEQLLDDDTFYALLKTNFTARQIEQLIDTDEFYETVKTIFTLRQQGQLIDDDTFQEQVITLAKTTRRILIT